MGLLHRKQQRKRRRLRAYVTLKCVMAGHQVGWCRGLCRPIDGQGLCGRLAPHDLKGRHQLAIERYNARQEEDEEQQS